MKPSRYARVLRLQRLRPGPLTCFGLLEGSLVLGGLLALSELVPWWFGVSLPVLVAGVVKGVDALPRLSAALPGVVASLTEAVAEWSGASGTHAGRRRAATPGPDRRPTTVPAMPHLVLVGQRAADRPMTGRALLSGKGADWPYTARRPGRAAMGTISSNRALVTASSARAGRVARGVAPVPEDSRAPRADPADRADCHGGPPAGRTRVVGAWPMPADPAASTPQGGQERFRRSR